MDDTSNYIICIEHKNYSNEEDEIAIAKEMCNKKTDCLGFNFDLEYKHSCLKYNIDKLTYQDRAGIGKKKVDFYKKIDRTSYKSTSIKINTILLFYIL